MKLHCPQFQDDLTAFHHGELPLWKRVLLRRHLSHCAQCREELDIMQKISISLQETEVNSPEGVLDAGLRERILSNLPPASETDATPLVMQRRPAWMAWSLSAATACVAVMILLPFFSQPGENARQASSESTLKQIEIPKPAGEAASQALQQKEATTRHLDGANFSFNDGHVDWLKPKKMEAESFTRNQAQKRIAQVPSAGAASEEEAYRGVSPEQDKIVITPYRRVHKEGSLAVEVRRIEQSSDEVESMIEKAGGFVATNTLSTRADGLKTAALEIRIPVKEFDAVMKQIAALGEVKSKNVQGQDITAQVSDADEENNIIAHDLRLKWKAYEAAKKRAAEKNRGVPNDWQQRTDIRRMRIELAQVRARLELLKKMSDYANLTVQLQEQSATGGGFLNGIGQTGQAAFDSFLLAARLPINLLIYILAYAPLWLPLLIGWRYFMKIDSRRAPQP